MNRGREAKAKCVLMAARRLHLQEWREDMQEWYSSGRGVCGGSWQVLSI